MERGGCIFIKIDSIFDSEESEEILINVSDNSLDASIIVQQFMRSATVEYLDAEAVQDISREVEYMLSNEKDDWELWKVPIWTKRIAILKKKYHKN